VDSAAVRVVEGRAQGGITLEPSGVRMVTGSLPPGRSQKERFAAAMIDGG
jgi:hypothetical protein